MCLRENIDDKMDLTSLNAAACVISGAADFQTF